MSRSDVSGPEPPPQPGPAPRGPDALETPWRRLDPRMLLVHPVQEAIRFLPALVGVFVLGRSQGGGDVRWWELVTLVFVVGVGVLRYLTTRFRIENGQIELRTGLLNKRVIATPEDRVRTVDLTAPPFHRVLGLAKVEVGTAGATRERLVLDALSLAEARRMREELIHRRNIAGAAETSVAETSVAETSVAEVSVAAASLAAAGPAAPADEASAHGSARPRIPAPVERGGAGADETVLVALDPRWVRYAPLTMSGLLSALAILGFGNQFVRAVLERGYVRDAVRRLGGHAWWVELLAGLVTVAVAVSVLAMLGYVLQYWRFRLTRHRGGTLHVTRGLLTTRETSIEEKRLRGVEVGEPLGLRLGRGGRLKAITTGLSRREDDQGSAWLVPPAPRAVVASVAAAVVSDRPALDMPLTPHGVGARRRRHLRAAVPSACLAALVLLATWRLGWPVVVAVLGAVPLAAAPVLARDRYAGLGHGLSAEHLVVRSGSLARRRDVLQRSGIIGWTMRSSWFQRRAGLVTLVATTAAGKQSYRALDVPEARATAVAHDVDPRLVAQFLCR